MHEGRVYHDGPLVNSQKRASIRTDDTHLRNDFYEGISVFPASHARTHSSLERIRGPPLETYTQFHS